jgi:glycosyltransferase involved in cell wall biosynthesis
VAVRDAGQYLPGLCEALSVQDYPAYEVLVVDDGLTDETAGLLADISRQDSRFRVVENQLDRRGKKGAVATGLQHAVHELIALTDVDCRPGRFWLRSIARHQSNRGSIVVGYGPYMPESTLLNTMVRFETLSTAVLTAGAIGLGHPYMAVGRNLSYPKALGLSVRKASKGSELLSGDDDLLVQSAHRMGIGVRYALDPDAFVASEAPRSFRHWLRQKRRHFSASRAYDLPVLSMLAVFHLSALLCWLAPLGVGLPGLAALAAKFAVQWPVSAVATHWFEEKGLIARLPFLEVAWMMVQIVAAPLGFLFPPRKW